MSRKEAWLEREATEASDSIKQLKRLRREFHYVSTDWKDEGFFVKSQKISNEKLDQDVKRWLCGNAIREEDAMAKATLMKHVVDLPNYQEVVPRKDYEQLKRRLHDVEKRLYHVLQYQERVSASICERLEVTRNECIIRKRDFIDYQNKRVEVNREIITKEVDKRRDNFKKIYKLISKF
jgi:hypothetical protein